MTVPVGKGVEIEPGILRLRAANPSPMTGDGTWTHLVGRRDVAVIDPGPADPAHLEAILAAVPPGGRITAILVTHAHLDHSALAPWLAERTGCEVMAFGPAHAGRSSAMQRLVGAGLTGGGEGIDHAFRPDRDLVGGDSVEGDGWRLEAVHTPGHMGGHLSFRLGDLLFPGDHVMGWAPSLVSPPDGDMGAYIRSLEQLATRTWRRFLPTHGDPVDHPAARLAELIAHRRAREAQVLAALAEGARDLEGVTTRVYRDLAPALLPAARRNALAHLIDLAERNLIEASPFPGPDALWTLR